MASFYKRGTYQWEACSSSEFQRVRIISRSLDGRASPDNRLVELLADATQELVSGLGSESTQGKATLDQSLKTE